MFKLKIDEKKIWNSLNKYTKEIILCVNNNIVINKLKHKIIIKKNYYQIYNKFEYLKN